MTTLPWWRERVSAYYIIICNGISVSQLRVIMSSQITHAACTIFQQAPLTVKEKSSVARSSPLVNLLPQFVWSIINCLLQCYWVSLMGNSEFQSTIVSCWQWRHRRLIQLTGPLPPNSLINGHYPWAKWAIQINSIVSGIDPGTFVRLGYIIACAATKGLRPRALHAFLSFAHGHDAFTVIPLLSKDTFTSPSRLTPVYPVPTIHFLLTHPFSPSTYPTNSKVSEPHYSPTPFLFQLFYSLLNS